MSDPGTISLILRLVGTAVAGGGFVGQVEIVQTGERVAIHSTDELVGLARRLASPPTRGTDEEGDGHAAA